MLNFGTVNRANSIKNAVDLGIKLELLLVTLRLHLLIQLRLRLELRSFERSELERNHCFVVKPTPFSKFNLAMRL